MVVEMLQSLRRTLRFDELWFGATAVIGLLFIVVAATLSEEPWAWVTPLSFTIILSCLSVTNHLRRRTVDAVIAEASRGRIAANHYTIYSADMDGAVKEAQRRIKEGPSWNLTL